MTSERTPSGGRGSADAPFDFRDHLRRQRDTFLDGPATNTTIIDLRAWLERRRPEPTILDDLRDLWADIAAEPGSHLAACFAGILVGLAVTLGIAFVWSLFL